MMSDMLLIILLVLVPTVVQLMAISVYTERLARAIRRTADQPPFTTTITIVELGFKPRSIARLLDRATRLDGDEIDALLANGGGQLPLPMSQTAGLRLVQELRQLGAIVEVRNLPAPLEATAR